MAAVDKCRTYISKETILGIEPRELVEFLQRTLIEKLPIFLVNTLLLIRFHKHSFTPYPSLSGQVGISSIPSSIQGLFLVVL